MSQLSCKTKQMNGKERLFLNSLPRPMMVNVFSTIFSKDARLSPAEIDAVLSQLDTQPYPPHDKELFLGWEL